MFRMGRQSQGNAKCTEPWICRQTNLRQIKCAVFLRSLLMIIFFSISFATFSSSGRCKCVDE